MKLRVLLFALLIPVGNSIAQAPPASPPQTAPVPAASAPEDEKKAAPAQDPDAATPPKPAAARGSPQRFEPSERVRPDFDVAFPVDI